MSHVTTHVLDAALGTPAAGVPVQLFAVTSLRAAALLGSSAALPHSTPSHSTLPHSTPPTGESALLASGTTDADGRIPSLGPDVLSSGTYRLVFDTATYFAGAPTFYPSVTIDFAVTDAAHYHVPLLLSPFAYSTYRGS
jgi:5-hydroxyisourate hydrolase